MDTRTGKLRHIQTANGFIGRYDWTSEKDDSPTLSSEGRSILLDYATVLRQPANDFHETGHVLDSQLF